MPGQDSAANCLLKGREAMGNVVPSPWTERVCTFSGPALSAPSQHLAAFPPLSLDLLSPALLSYLLPPQPRRRSFRFLSPSRSPLPPTLPMPLILDLLQSGKQPGWLARSSASPPLSLSSIRWEARVAAQTPRSCAAAVGVGVGPGLHRRAALNDKRGY